MTLSNDQLRPLAPYEQCYEHEARRFRMPTSGEPAVWRLWRQAFRTALRERMGGFPAASVPLDVVIDSTTTHPGYRRSLLSFTSEPGVRVPAWLLIPDELTKPAPAAIAVHGHGYGADDLVGINRDGSDRDAPQGYHKDFALALCRRGMVVIAPEMRGFGRRRELTEQARDPDQSSCWFASLWGIMLGKPLLGGRVWDVMRTIDLLVALPEVDAERIGIMGISGGGMTTLFASALDERLQAAVVSGYLSTFRDSILNIEHCLCNYLPGLLAEAEMYDVAALIAPRPMLIEAGTRDDIFPIASVEHSYAVVHNAYKMLAAADRLDKDIFEGDHQISGAKAYDFLWHWLNQGNKG